MRNLILIIFIGYSLYGCRQELKSNVIDIHKDFVYDSLINSKDVIVTMHDTLFNWDNVYLVDMYFNGTLPVTSYTPLPEHPTDLDDEIPAPALQICGLSGDALTVPTELAKWKNLDRFKDNISELEERL